MFRLVSCGPTADWGSLIGSASQLVHSPRLQGGRKGRDGGRGTGDGGQGWRMVGGKHRVSQAFHRRKRTPPPRLSVELKRQENCRKRETSLVSSTFFNVGDRKKRKKKSGPKIRGLLLCPGLPWSKYPCRGWRINHGYGIKIHFYVERVAPCVSPQPWNKHRRRGSLCPPRVEEPEKVSCGSRRESHWLLDWIYQSSMVIDLWREHGMKLDFGDEDVLFLIDWVQPHYKNYPADPNVSLSSAGRSKMRWSRCRATCISNKC